MNDQPRVSVAIPVYNGEETIAGVIQSVLDQTYQDLEIIVVDNCSSDRTEAIVKEFDDRVEYRQNETNVGAVNNFTRAADAANGEYTKVLCADDKLMPTCIEEQVSALDRYPNVVMTSSRRRLTDPTGKVLRKAHPGRLGMTGLVLGEGAIRRIARSGANPIGETSSVLFRSQARRDAGAFSVDYPYLVDVEMWSRLLAKGDLYAAREALCEFRVGNASWSNEIGNLQAEQCAGFVRSLGEKYPDIVSKSDVALGVAAAHGKAKARRVVYGLLARRRKG